MTIDMVVTALGRMQFDAQEIIDRCEDDPDRESETAQSLANSVIGLLMQLTTNPTTSD